MEATTFLFYGIAGFTLVTAFLAVTTRLIFRSAIWLLFSLIGVAAIYFWMGVNFIAAVQIIVYVGGIVVLIIFSIFLTQQSGEKMTSPKHNRMLFALLAVILGFGFTITLINQHGFSEQISSPYFANVAEIGTQLLSMTQHGYILPFEVVSILLLAAMIGCIVIAIKPKGVTQNDIDKMGNEDPVTSPAPADRLQVQSDYVYQKKEEIN